MDGMLVWTADSCIATDTGTGPAQRPPRGGGRWLSRAARCLGMTTTNLSLSYPPDADEHFREVQRQLRPWTQGARPHRHSGFEGPWLENRWISHFEAEYARVRARGGRLRDVFGPWVPVLVPWTDLRAANPNHAAGSAQGLRGPSLFAALRAVMRPGVPYVTLVQHDEGLDSREVHSP